MIIPQPLLLSDVLRQLRAADLVNATPARIHYLIASGQLPRPALDSRHSFIFTQEHVDRLRDLLAEMPSARRTVPQIT